MSLRPIISLRIRKDIKDALALNGYETVRDILSTTPTLLAHELKISVTEAENIIHQVQTPSTQANPSMPLTQNAAVVMKSTRKFSTRWPPLDKLLEGGLLQGHILELSGPPGSPKETIAIDIAASFLEAGENVIFVDSQNMTSPKILREKLSGLSPSSLRSLHYIRILTATEIMVFLHSLNTILDSMPKTTLLVLNSFSYPFSTLPNPRAKPGIFELIKQALVKVSVARNVAVVITSQLATKMLKEDGSYGSFDEGGRGTMVPQLGHSYLPSGRSHRVILSLDSPVSGVMYLLPPPSQTFSTTPVPHESYSL